MPDGRKAGTPLSPGANPSYGAEQNGLLASLNSLTKLPYEWALDGISNTQTMNPDALGHNEEERINNLVNVMDGYFDQGAHHLNVNVFGKDKLLDAMEHPEKPEYANFTIRVSGYAVKFIDLTKEQQMDVSSRTFHDRMYSVLFFKKIVSKLASKWCQLQIEKKCINIYILKTEYQDI